MNSGGAIRVQRIVNPAGANGQSVIGTTKDPSATGCLENQSADGTADRQRWLKCRRAVGKRGTESRRIGRG